MPPELERPHRTISLTYWLLGAAWIAFIGIAIWLLVVA